MVVKWLRERVSAAAILTIFRLYLGYAWLTAGWHKITEGFDATGFLKGALAQASGEHPAVQGWWASFIENVALPNVRLFNVLVPWGETLVGIALILGIFTTFAALMGAVMNFAFMFSGTTSTNPQMILLTVFILVAGANAGKFGFDRWIIPYIRKFSKKGRHRNVITVS
ncbi:DoxX family protein [Thermaerobacillus caldiproteolyticus]|uniref:Thiosulfate dehydrogenase [quinone] large subunit n=1 Tax=Thermaerobacillus caldiproteolyticus TaxID=247480 RepID=A0A7V9Z715_9BACL|nr:DoxX family protein [Anoxybacillus caldiproteolyticus]MBA2875115.1 thiosulfate dehydrogenase [quinone] large subunit [Anoxybacillus caldiproteolyticus]